jgi:hypothetical protein
VLTFPQDILGDPGRYREAATLPVPAAPGFAACPDAVMAAAVRARRDLAVEGFAQLRAGVQARGPSALADLYAGAATLVAGSVPRWQEICANGVLDQGAASAAALADLGAGRAPHLWQGAVASRTASCGQRAYGLCGRLQTWSP